MYMGIKRFIAKILCIAIICTMLPLHTLAANKPNAETPLQFMDCILPAPIVGSLSNNCWGAADVGARDQSNGLEDSGIGTDGEHHCYWDGGILKDDETGVYYMFASRWDEAKGHEGWPDSVAVYATSNNLYGPYVEQGTLWTDSNGAGHNVFPLKLRGDERIGEITAKYAIVLGDTSTDSLKGAIFVSDSLAGPWKNIGQMQIENGTFWLSNVCIVLTPEGKYLAYNRYGDIAQADTISGPWSVQKNTLWNDISTLTGQNDVEDPVVWYADGLYHCVVNRWNAKQAYYFTSKDGITNWREYAGTAYCPSADLFQYENSDVVNHWCKIERPNVYIENGEVKAMTFSVIDVEKDEEKGNDTHGSKVVVVPFNNSALQELNKEGISAIEDVHVQSWKDESTTNYSDSDYLCLKGNDGKGVFGQESNPDSSSSNTDDCKIGFLKFNLGAYRAQTITKAELCLSYRKEFTSTNAMDKIRVALASGNWTEAAAKWNSKPTVAGDLIVESSEFSLAQTNQLIKMDVTALVKKAIDNGDDSVTLALSETAGASISISSKEYYNGYAPNLIITAEPQTTVPVTGIKLNQSSLHFNQQNSSSSAQLTATVQPADATNQKVIWKTSDDTIATVSDTGLVTALLSGTAIITATTEDGGYTASCTVTNGTIENLCPNPGFEEGLWKVDSNHELVTEAANVHSGKNAVKLTAETSLGRTVSGLQPDTWYKLSAFLKGGTAWLGAKNYGESSEKVSEIKKSVASPNTYEQQTVMFHTGVNSTSAVIYVWLPDGESNAYVDDFELVAMPDVFNAAESCASFSITPANGVESNNPAKNAIDGKMSTRWCSHGNAVYQLDLGKTETLLGVELWMESTSSSFIVATSDDGITWTERSTALNGKTDTVVQQLFTEAIAAQYVKFSFTGSYPGCYELRVLAEDLQSASEIMPSPILQVSFDHETADDETAIKSNGSIVGNPDFVDGILGKAIHFKNPSGSDKAAAQYVNFGQTDELKFGTGDFTVMFWYKADSGIHTEGSIISNKDWNSGDNCGFNIGDMNEGINLNFNDSTSSSRAETDRFAAATDNTWHHIAAVVDRSGRKQIRLYIDGAPATNGNGGYGTLKSNYANISGYTGTIDATDWVLGADGVKYRGVEDACVDELAIYASALSAAQIKNNFDTQKLSQMEQQLDGLYIGTRYTAGAVAQMKSEIAEARRQITGGTLTTAGVTKLLAQVQSDYETFLDGAPAAISFHLVSDLHVGSDSSSTNNQNLAAGLQDMKRINPDALALLSAGDNTQDGASAQVSQFYSILNSNNPLGTTGRMLLALGNHDVRGVNSSDWGTSNYWDTAKNLYMTNNGKYMPEGTETTYYDYTIGGYHFIVLNLTGSSKDTATLSEEELSWLDTILTENDETGKPAFVVIHQALNDTHWRGAAYGGFGAQDAAVKAILEKHPQTVLFSGHIHNGFGLVEAVSRTYGTMIDVPSFVTPEVGLAVEGSGYEVYVYADEIYLRARNFVEGEWLPDYDISIPLPALPQVLHTAKALDSTAYTAASWKPVADCIASANDMLNKTYDQSSVQNGESILPAAYLYHSDMQLTLQDMERTLSAAIDALVTAQLGGSVSITGSAIFGQTLTANTSRLTPSNATVSYQWTRNKTVVGTNNSYTITADDVGSTINLVVTGTGDYTGSLSAATSPVEKAENATTPTGVTATACTAETNNDGTLTGVTMTMEYRLKGSEKWIPGTGKTITGLAAGTYEIRFAETGTHKAGKTIEVTVLPYTAPQQVAAVTADPAAGSYTQTQSVSLATTTAGASIYYTTDNSTPTKQSTRYTGAITVDKSTTIKAIAIKDGMADSNVASFQYTITISVPVAVTGVTLSRDRLSFDLRTGVKTAQLTATVQPENATNMHVTWESSNEDVVTVKNGLVTAIGNGTATITVKTEDGGFGATCAVTVKTSSRPSGGSTTGGSTPVKEEKPVDTTPDTKTEFTDMIGHWAGDAVDFVVNKGLFNGTSNTTFSPNVAMTRGMLMTVLARLDGQNTTGGTTWYEKGMNWAKKQGVSDGSNPEGLVTREQLAVMLYRYAGSPRVSGAELSAFKDGAQISNYARDAMLWAVQNGILTGKSGALLDPKGNATRAEVAVMLMRMVQLKQA